jgi:hypothetical protein
MYECIQVQIHNMIWKYNQVNKGIGDGDNVDDDHDGDRCGGLLHPLSLCVVVMVEICVEAAMEAAGLPLGFPSLNMLMEVGFVILISSIANMLVVPSQMVFRFTKHSQPVPMVVNIAVALLF